MEASRHTLAAMAKKKAANKQAPKKTAKKAAKKSVSKKTSKKKVVSPSTRKKVQRRPAAKQSESPQPSLRGGGKRLGDETRTTLQAIERWKQTAADEVDNIGGWRDAEPGDRYHMYWSDPARLINTEHGTTMPRGFESATTYLLSRIWDDDPKRDLTPIQEVYGAVSAWHADHNAERVPEQRVLLHKLEQAMLVVRAVEAGLHRATSADNAASSRDGRQRRLRWLVDEVKTRIGECREWTELGGLHPLLTEAAKLADSLGFPGAPLTLTFRRRGEPGFRQPSNPEDEDITEYLEFTSHDPVSGFSVGVIGCLRPGTVNGKPGLIVVDYIFSQWKADTLRSMEAWGRAVDGLHHLPPAAGAQPEEIAGKEEWEATLRRVHRTVRESPDRFREAGAWLDSEYSESAVRERQRRCEAEESTGHPSAAQMPAVEPGKDTRFWRLNCVGLDWRAEPPDLSLRSLDEPRVWAERVLLYICLVTDRGAGEYAADLTELASLPWEKGTGSDLGRGWCDPDDIWGGLAPWAQLVRDAFALLITQADLAAIDEYATQRERLGGHNELPLQRPIPTAKAAAQVNDRTDVILRKLRARSARIVGPKRAYTAELDDVIACYPQHKKALTTWADKNYPAASSNG